MAPRPDPGNAPRVEVVYARPDRQRVVELPFADGMTALEAVQAAGLARDFPEIASHPLELGVFGKRVEPGRVLRAGDRVEIYRSLPDDPKERRRRKAAAASASRQGRNR